MSSYLQTHLQTYTARLAQLWADAQQPPPSGARPLHVAGVRCGWIASKAQAVLANLVGAGVSACGSFWELGRGLTPGVQLNAHLRAAALALRAAGCLPGWRDELLDVLENDPSAMPGHSPGRLLGRIERAATRPLGLLTRAVHLNAWTPDGQLWIARRALSKATAPGLWDTLVGGLVGSGETLDQALLRESDEEAGLSVADIAARAPLRRIGRMHVRVAEGYQVEDILTSDCVLAEAVRPANRDGEVMEIRYAPVSEVLAMIEAGLFTQEAVLVLVEDMLRRCRLG